MERLYQLMLNYIHQYSLLERNIIFLCHYLPYITFGLYPCLLIYLFFIKSDLLLITIIKPLSAFLFVTLFRKIINRKRPYETMQINPLFKHKSGESFPSRHTVSAFIIALVCFYVNIYLGIFALSIAIMISISRILAGVHYISDVIASIVIAVIIYLI